VWTQTGEDMTDPGQSLETDFFSRRGISVKRTKRVEQGCSVLLTGPQAQRLRLKIEGPGYDSDERLLGELLFYSHCPTDAAKIRKDDEITDGRALGVLAFSTVKLGKQVREFIASVNAVTPHSTESADPSTELPASLPPSFWRRVIGVVRNAAVAAYDIFREAAVSCSCIL
jgi:hypothetical protein